MQARPSTRWQSWPHVLVLVAVFAAVVMTGVSRPDTLGTAVEALGAWLALTCSLCGIPLVVHAVVARFQRPPDPAIVARRLVYVSAAGLQIAGLAAFANRHDVTALIAMLAIAASLIALAAGLHKMGPRAWTWVLVGMLLAVTIARETGILEVTLARTRIEVRATHRFSSNCEPGALTGPRVLMPELQGNVGSLVVEPAGSLDARDLRFRVSGPVDVAPTCYLPLVKPVTSRASLSVRYDTGTAQRGCDGSGQIDLELSATAFGLSSCRSLRAQLAERLHRELTTIMSAAR